MPSHLDQHAAFTAFEIDELQSAVREAVHEGFKDALFATTGIPTEEAA
jgi:hypothetical protein